MGRRCHVGRGSVVRREGLVRSWWGVLDVGSRGRIGLEAVPNRVLEYRLESRLAGERDRVRCTRGGSAKGGLASVKHEDFAEPRLLEVLLSGFEAVEKGPSEERAAELKEREGKKRARRCWRRSRSASGCLRRGARHASSTL